MRSAEAMPVRRSSQARTTTAPDSATMAIASSAAIVAHGTVTSTGGNGVTAPA